MNSRVIITRRVEFDAAHRLREHESKCRHVHGHRYVVEASFSAPELDKIGRVVDFGILKEKLQTWIDANWDHTIILHQDDKELGRFIDGHTGQTSFYMPCNPTAENMAAFLAELCRKELFASEGIELVSLKLFETPNCSATVC
ncbi:6-carboxy-5,6,7,8-tetrahydropterin synthase [bacterium]|nr:6-carboxy-5,6,7,8-tetrahydropterin synthase [bacterium]